MCDDKTTSSRPFLLWILLNNSASHGTAVRWRWKSVMFLLWLVGGKKIAPTELPANVFPRFSNLWMAGLLRAISTDTPLIITSQPILQKNNRLTQMRFWFLKHVGFLCIWYEIQFMSQKMSHRHKNNTSCVIVNRLRQLTTFTSDKFDNLRKCTQRQQLSTLCWTHTANCLHFLQE